jgi:hypothetical protein
MYNQIFNFGMKNVMLIIVLFFLLPELIFAQGACCGGSGGMGTSITRFGMETAGPGNLHLLLAYDLNYMNSLFDDDVKLEDNDNQRVIHTGILMANYGISRKFSVAAIMPYIVQELGYNSLDGRKQVDYMNGLGDMILMIKFRITNPLAYNGWGLYAGIGPKLPTGSSSNTSSTGSIYPMDVQLGTGSLDAISWLSLSKSHIFISNLHLNTGATFRLSGQNRHYKDSLTYRTGDEFQCTAGLSYNFYSKFVFEIFNYVQYRYQSVDKLTGEPVEQTGGHWLTTSPGIRVNFTQNLSFVVSTDIPLYRYLNGPQLTTTSRFSAAFTYNIATRKPIEIGPDQ